MSARPITVLASTLAATIIVVPISARSAEPCDFHLSFSRPDEQGTKKVNVYEGGADPFLKRGDLSSSFPIYENFL
jgi:hypothetical protein